MPKTLGAIAVVVLGVLHGAVASAEPEMRGNETIVIDGAPPKPAVKARPLKNYLPRGADDNHFMRPAPAYSDAAIEHDVWKTAWLLLDIDDRGAVTRVKFLNKPGYDLEPIAVQTARDLAFEPAHASDGRPMSSFLIFPIEWPSHGWLLARTGLATGIPDESGVPCRGSGPLKLGSIHPTYRDCSAPAIENVNSAPWVAVR